MGDDLPASRPAPVRRRRDRPQLTALLAAAMSKAALSELSFSTIKVNDDTLSVEVDLFRAEDLAAWERAMRLAFTIVNRAADVDGESSVRATDVQYAPWDIRIAPAQPATPGREDRDPDGRSRPDPTQEPS